MERKYVYFFCDKILFFDYLSIYLCLNVIYNLAEMLLLDREDFSSKVQSCALSDRFELPADPVIKLGVFLEFSGLSF